ncbi:type I restriction enzyme M protein [Povalibacter uvarum]|uniref:site-specific DNA-methyltransferase (adenine-specific) n=1 Tax=Povalibacter uvarum TaxID=732238 RepID=A0A841HUG1_9GAMM|nr:N-6 DNA methylase [Povalibacter uvarum]MBB6095622.1 type I restriction enzyme M protein [Povalibacter uvarum]
MNQVTQDIGQKLWNLCNLLRDDGVTYHQYVTELTYLLFLKMAKETGQEEKITAKYRWDVVEKKARDADLDGYKEMLLNLGRTTNVLVKQIFANATTAIRKPKTLSELVNAIDELNWYSVDREQMGDLYEDLLERNASEKKSGAGQYFTPRPLIDAMVAVMQPGLDDVIQDPAAGTAGFLISAWQYISKHHDLDSLKVEKIQKLRRNFHGMELVQDAHRLALMNLMLHGFEHVDGMHLGDTLTDEGAKLLPSANLILTNPPFGTKKGGGVPSRSDFVFLTSNKQLAFVEHIYKNLKPGGRAAVVVPDNVLFEGNTGVDIRRDLMNKCHLHTILRLPTGIFYAQGVNTNVLFFTKVSESAVDSTKEVWVYDLRANMPAFGKRTPLTREHFKEFERAFGKDQCGEPKSLAKRKDEGEQGRFRKFTREEIARRGDSLDIAWLRDESEGSGEELPEPAVLAREAMAELEGAIGDLRRILVQLGEEEASEVGEVVA